jgi:hypothetical protein
MIKNSFSPAVTVFMCILLVIWISFIPCCKKSPSEPPSETSVNQTTNDTTAQPPAQPAVEPVANETDNPQATEADNSTAQTIEAATTKETVPSGWVPIDIKLPKAVFIGTPQDTRVPNLEKPRPQNQPRPPFFAPAGTTNVAFGKPVTSSDSEPIIGELSYITDGDKEAADGSYVELGPMQQYVTIDLEGMYQIYAIVVWHHHMQAQVYYDVVVQVADDPDFVTNVRTLFNNDIDNSAGFGIGKDMHYTETNEGKLIDAKGVKARYVRLYSNGNTSDDLNRYTEVEVYGKPVE